MEKELIVGAEYQSQTIVNESNTAQSLGSGDMAVFATPAMVALMENAAMMAVAPHLEQGATTVGVEINTSHIKASPLGATITASAQLIAIEGRKLSFKVKAWDSQGTIGEGSHTRFVVDRERFLSKIK